MPIKTLQHGQWTTTIERRRGDTYLVTTRSQLSAEHRETPCATYLEALIAIADHLEELSPR